MTQFQAGATFIMPPVMVSKAPGVDIPAIDELENYLNKNSQAIDKLFCSTTRTKNGRLW